jgi:hypothetical protein
MPTMTPTEVLITIPVAKKGGWWRRVTSTDRTQKGGFAFIGPEAFLRAGENLVPIGAVILEADDDGTARLWYAHADGRIAIRDADDGTHSWYRYKTATISLCARIDALLALSVRDLLVQSVARLATLAEIERASAIARGTDAATAACTTDTAARAAKAAERLAAYDADAEHAPVDARAVAIADIRARMATAGLTVADIVA